MCVWCRVVPVPVRQLWRCIVAAYLLYTNRERLSKAGVLVVGPSNSFMWYIERVLPSLGETGVVMSSLATLYPGLRAVPEKDRAVAALKGDLRMVKVIKCAVADRQKVPAQVQRLNVRVLMLS